MAAEDPVGSGGPALVPAGSPEQLSAAHRTVWQRRWLNRVLTIVALLAIVVTQVLSHDPVPERLDSLGSAVCGQLPDHSYSCGERQLPLCARCTGTYLGVLVAFVVLGIMGRGRANKLPPVTVLLTLVLFVALWALDGLNSYVTLFKGSPLLYEPSNQLRMVTGLLQGMALMVIMRPVVAFTIWAESNDEHVVRGHAELLPLIVVAAAVGLAVQSELPWLYYPLALSSVAGELLILTLVNTLIVCILLRREGMSAGWRQAAPLWLLGLAAALIEINLINFGKIALGQLLGIPL